MSTELATIQPTSTDLTIAPGQTGFSPQQRSALEHLGVENATEGDLAVFFHYCVRTGLDPFAKQIYMIGRQQTDRDTNTKVTKFTIQTGIDGFRLIARRAADAAAETLSYDDPAWTSADGKWRDFWVGATAPAAARVSVYRAGQKFSGVANYAEYVQTKYNGSPNSMWAKMPANQLAKCAEAQALRKAFPQDLSGVYIDEEMGRAEVVDAEEAPNERPARGSKLRAAVGVAEPAPMIDDQIAEMGTLFSQLGASELTDKAALASNALGFDLVSFRALTFDQAQTVIDALTALAAENA